MSPRAGFLAPDRDQLGTFVEVMFRYADEGTFVSLRSFDHRAGSRPFDIKPVRIGANLERVTDVAVRMVTKAANAPEPIVFAPPVATFTNGDHAAEADLANGVALSVECDSAPRAARARLEGLLGPATIALASGGAWTNPETGEVEDKAHLHWRLSEPTRTPEEHARLKLARKLAAALAGGDHTTVPSVHPLRWPGSWHRKGEPRLCRIVDLREDADLDLDEAVDRLEAAAAAAGISLERIKAAGAGEDRESAELIRLIVTGTEYLGPLVALSARYAGRGMGAKQIEQTLRGFLDAVPEEVRDVKDGAVTPGRWADRTRNLGRMARSAVAKFAPPPIDPHPAADFLGKVAEGTLVECETTRPEIEAEGDALLDLSHDGLALDLGARWASSARHVALWGRWLFWNGSRWEPDEKLLHMTRGRAYLRHRADGLVRAVNAGRVQGMTAEKAESTAKDLRSAQTVAHVVGMARSNPAQAASVGQWDADPWLLGTPGGTVDLRTGAMRPADPNDHITKSTSVTPAPAGTAAPQWGKFLERIFRHDPELVGFMQRVIGYALTGSVKEHALVFAWGQGGNGKGVFFNTMSRLLGDYAAVAPADLLLVTQSDRHPTDMAMLRGARLVTAQELAPGRAWDEPKLKSLTGGDPITARFMRQDFFTYDPQFFLAVAGNHKPSFKGVDEAIRRRINLVPFLQNIPAEERDKDLPDKLMAEAPAILRWAIEGCLEWQRVGLAAPASVREASEEYLSAEDVMGQWLEERCEVSAAIGMTGTTTLYTDWREWCAAGNLQPGSSKAFAQRLSERGFQLGRSNAARGFVGIGLRTAFGTSPGASDGCDGSPHIDRNARAQAPAHTHTSHMQASVTSVTGSPEARPWSDHAAWVARVNDAPDADERVERLCAWARAAGGEVDTRSEPVTLLIPRELPHGMARSHLLNLARLAKLGIAERTIAKGTGTRF